MSAEFAALALSYSMGNGSISLRGKRRRPWLELRRSELERTYLDHQLRMLRRAHDGPVEVIWDRLPDKGFYDIERIQFHGDGLWRAYELAYPRDQRRFTQAVADLFDIRHVANIWTDRGRVYGRRGRFRLGLSPEELAIFHDMLLRLGLPKPAPEAALAFHDEATGELFEKLRPHIHVSMRRVLSRRGQRYRPPKLRALEGA